MSATIRAVSRMLLVLASVNLIQGQSVEDVRHEDPRQISAPSVPLPQMSHRTTNLCATPFNNVPAEQFASAANRWMRVPVEIRKRQDAVPSERHARDSFWDRLIPASLPLSDPCSRPKPLPIADFFPEEFSDKELEEGAWLVGTFEDHSTQLSASELSVYTEIKFRVSRVLGSPNIPGLKNGSGIFIGCAGGTITAPWGKEISFRVYPKRYFFQPSHTYLLHLSYVEDGNFFVFNEGLGRRWDVTDGIAEPDTAMEVSKRQGGKPLISGLTVEKAVEVLTSRIDKVQRTERQ
jgi:hypothetical protein